MCQFKSVFVYKPGITPFHFPFCYGRSYFIIPKGKEEKTKGSLLMHLRGADQNGQQRLQHSNSPINKTCCGV
jgi:hypothetical protein